MCVSNCWSLLGEQSAYNWPWTNSYSLFLQILRLFVVIFKSIIQMPFLWPFSVQCLHIYVILERPLLILAVLALAVIKMSLFGMICPSLSLASWMRLIPFVHLYLYFSPRRQNCLLFSPLSIFACKFTKHAGIFCPINRIILTQIFVFQIFLCNELF